MSPRLDAVRAALAARDPLRVRGEHAKGQRASVSVLFAGPHDDLQLCLIRRAIRDGDPWSGHMALPGGRTDPGDLTPRDTAQRETFEEVGLDLSDTEYLGPLDEVALHRPLCGRLAPFAFYVGRELPPLRPEPTEVDEALWFSAAQLWSRGRRTTTRWPLGGREIEFPGIEVGAGVVWGLTFRVLTELGAVIGSPLPPPLVEPDLPRV